MTGKCGGRKTKRVNPSRAPLDCPASSATLQLEL
jgi:hypothetical protein